MKRPKFGLSLIVGVLMVLFAGGAATAQYGTTTSPSSTPITLPTVTVVAGQQIDVYGNNCPAGSTVTITWDDGTVLGTTIALPDGSWRTTITIPVSATPGNHTITATCGNIKEFLTVDVVVQGTTVTTPAVTQTTLARTGTSNIGPLLGIGGAALVLGAAFVYGARRPRTDKV